MNIEITEIKVFKFERKGALLGYANIVLNDCFKIKGIRLLENRQGKRFISMPSRKINGKRVIYKDWYHPLTKELNDMLLDKVFTTYDNM